MKKNKLPKIKIPSAKRDHLPASRKMLRMVRDELKSDFRSLSHKMDSMKIELKTEISELRVEVRTEGKKLRAEMKKIYSISEKSNAKTSRMLALYEEQNANNRIVLEGHQALWQRQERIEQQLIAKQAF